MKQRILYTPTPWLTKAFLVLLRLAIGWHLFVEGSSKLETFFTGPTGTSKPFSSKGYLQQSQGPLAPYFRQLAGDPDAYTLQMLEKPELLEAQWRDYVARYSAHYQLDTTQQTKAQEVLKQQWDEFREWLKTGHQGSATGILVCLHHAHPHHPGSHHRVQAEADRTARPARWLEPPLRQGCQQSPRHHAAGGSSQAANGTARRPRCPAESARVGTQQAAAPRSN